MSVADAASQVGSSPSGLRAPPRAGEGSGSFPGPRPSMGARPKPSRPPPPTAEEGPWRNELSAKHKKQQRRSDLVAGIIVTVGIVILVVGGYLSWKKAVGEQAPDPQQDVPTPTEPIATPDPTPTPSPTNTPPVPTSQGALDAAKAKHAAGDLPGALAELDLILKEPDSPLAEPALAQKMEWMEASSHALGRKTAKEYVKRFPDGPARAQADELLKRR